MADPIDTAVDVVRRGGVIAYPTEAVYGLGCDPANAEAVARVIALKQRPTGAGLILVGCSVDQVLAHADAIPDAAMQAVLATWPGPNTWIFPARAHLLPAIIGEHASVALRVTAHPIAAALCRRFAGALVSTSANRHGEAAARSAAEVRCVFADTVDFVVDGALGGLERATTIRDAITGKTLRV